MMMTMDNSRRVLNIAALFDFISGVLLTALGICGFALAFTALNTPDLAYKMSSFGGSSVIIGSCALLVLTGGLAIVEGFLALRAVKDPSRIMPVWVLSIVTLVLHVVSLIIDFAAGSFGLYNVFGVMIASMVFAAANSMKNEVEA